jgi:hypothetical protein
MQKFDITLKNDKLKVYRTFTLFIVVLQTLFFIYLLFVDTFRNQAIIGLSIITLYTLYRILYTRHYKATFYFDSVIYLLLSLFWLDTIWLFLVYFLLLLLLQIIEKGTRFSFCKNEIIMIGFPGKKYQWNQFSNIVLKDNILTLDFKNNKLLQAEITTININEDAFNTFAKEQLVNRSN